MGLQSHCRIYRAYGYWIVQLELHFGVQKSISVMETLNNFEFSEGILLLSPTNFVPLTVNSKTWQLWSLTGLLTAIVSILLLIDKFRDENFDKLPGPSGIWGVGMAHHMINPKFRIPTLTKWLNQHNPCCALRLGSQKIVFLTSTSGIQKLFSSSSDNYLNKGPEYNLFKPFWRDGMVISGGDKWKERKRLLVRAFTPNSLSGYLHVFNRQARSLIEELAVLSEPKTKNGNLGAPIDHTLWKHTFRVICEATMGSEVWKMEGSEQLPELLNTCKEICMKRVFQPWLSNDWIWSWLPVSKNLKQTVDKFTSFTQKIIDQRRQQLDLETVKPDKDIIPGSKIQIT